MGAFGEKLRNQREQRGIALEAISNTTKISTRMLRALEEERFDQLPGGVFNKGFVRAYARHIGLNEEDAVADYLAALRESQIQQQAILPNFRTPAGKAAAGFDQQNRRNHDLVDNDVRDKHPRDNNPPNNGPHRADLHNQDLHNQDLQNNDLRNHPYGHDPRRTSHHPETRGEDLRSSPLSNQRPSAAHSPAEQPPQGPSARVPWGKLAAALLLLTLVLAFWNSRRRAQLPAAPEPAASSSESPVPFSAPAPAATQPHAPATSLTTGQPSPAGTLTNSETANSETANSTTPAAPALNANPAPALAPANPPSSPSLGSAASATQPAANSPAPDANPPVARTRHHPVVAKSAPTFTLVIRAAETSWISITADGQPVARETLIAPANTSVHATREIVVKAGNAAALSFLLNGKVIPAQGSEGEVKTYTFDATGLASHPQPQ